MVIEISFTGETGEKTESGSDSETGLTGSRSYAAIDKYAAFEFDSRGIFKMPIDFNIIPEHPMFSIPRDPINDNWRYF